MKPDVQASEDWRTRAGSFASSRLVIARKDTRLSLSICQEVATAEHSWPVAAGPTCSSCCPLAKVQVYRLNGEGSLSRSLMS